MQFGVEASGTPFTKIGPALSKNFGYGDAKMYERENHNNDWTSIIMNELGNKRPVIYSGGNANSSHAFIIDGVDKDGKFHINWGWDGECNGYFDLNSLDPINDGGYNSYDGCNKLTKIYSLIDSPYEMSEIVFKSWTSNLY